MYNHKIICKYLFVSLIGSYNKIAVMFVVTITLIAHTIEEVMVPELYSWRSNTISDLAAQQYPFSWIMSVGLIIFGGFLLLGSLLQIVLKRRVWYREAPIMLCAASIILAGIFATKPFFPTSSISAGLDNAHSVFATISGFALALAILSHPLPIGRLSKKDTITSFSLLAIFTLIAVFYSISDIFFKEIVGIPQRFLWLVGVIWIMICYNSDEKKHQ